MQFNKIKHWLSIAAIASVGFNTTTTYEIILVTNNPLKFMEYTPPKKRTSKRKRDPNRWR